MLQSSQWRKTAESVGIPIAAVLFSLVLFGIFCMIAGANPFQVYSRIYESAFGSWRAFQGTLLRASPLMLTALCTALPARLGLMVIGNEGALVVGGLGAVAVGLGIGPALPPIATQFGMAIAGIVCGGVWIAIVGALRHYRAVNETISSLLMNYIAIALMNHLVGGPMRDNSFTAKPSSFAIPLEDKLGLLPATRIHYGLLYGLIVCAIAYFLIRHTTLGFATRTIGGNVKAARIAGIPVGKLTLLICFLGGSCAGLAGMVEVAAIHSRVNDSLVSGYGYAGILVAFVARHNPLAASLVSVMLGGILTSGGSLQRNLGLPDATTRVFQGLVFLVVLFSESLYGRLSLFKPPVAPPAAPPAPTSTAVST